MIEKIRSYYRKSSTKKKLLFYCLLGIIWSASNVGYTRFTTGFPAWITLAPFLFFIQEENYKKGAFFSLIFGGSLYISHLWWMTTPAFDLVRLGSFSLPVTLLIFAGVILVCLILWILQGTIYSVFFVALKFISRKNPYLFLAASPFVFTTLDFFYPKIWSDQLGYSQYVFFNLSQIADIFGVPAITFLIVSCNCAILAVLIGLCTKEKKLMHFLPLAAVIIITVLSVGYGIGRVKNIEGIMKQNKQARIGIVQANISGFAKRTLSFKEILAAFNYYTREIVAEDPDLIVWPESAIVAHIPDTMERYNWINSYGFFPLLFGSHYFEKEEKKLYNSMILLSADSRKLGVYNKQKLVPISEEIPITQLNFLMTIYGYAYFSRGESLDHLILDDLVIAANICYEAVFPDYIRKLIKGDRKESRANILINGTNDSWFGPYLEPEMHLAISGFRSIENRISLVRSTCTGYSAVFDPTGFLKYKSDIFKPETTVQDVYLMQTKTIFAGGGWIFVYLLALAVCIFLIIRTVKKVLEKKTSS